MHMSRGLRILPLLMATVISGCYGPNGEDYLGDKEACDQSAEAAHYIAAKSISIGNVNRVVGEVVADRKFPALGDKMIAAIGMVVITQKDIHKSPDEISAVVRQACESRHGSN